ncbi:MAG: type II secretion system protein [bacterium]
MKIKTKKGFTLIELIVVIAIIGFLTTVTIISLQTAKQKGSDAGKIKALAEINKALNIYFTDANGGAGTYPSGTDLSSLVNGPIKYIASIDSKIKYQGLTANNTVCSSGGCYSYVLYTILSDDKNKVLKSDKDVSVPSISFNGATSNCSSTGETTDLCYDITP